MNWRRFVLRLLRVPPEPEAPPGAETRVFNAAPNFLKLKMIQFFAGQFVVLIGFVFAIAGAQFLTEQTPTAIDWVIYTMEIVAWVIYIPQLILGFCTLRLDFEMRWYMVSNRAIRIREGVVTVREKTIALANIQNVSLNQGPLQRYLGIADVEVRTAGGGGGEPGKGKHQSESDSMHIGYFRGVANASEIRDVLREGVRRQRDSGLGDPDDHHHHHDDDAIKTAVAELLTEARAMRGVVSR